MRKENSTMTLIQNYTLQMLCADVLEGAKKDPEWGPALEKLGGYTLKCPWAMPYPIISKDISTSVKIEFTTGEGVAASIDVVGDIPIRREGNRLRLFWLSTDKADGDAYAAMYTVSLLLCAQIDHLIAEHSKVLVSDWSLSVTKKADDQLISTWVRDLLRRRNRQVATDLNGKNGKSGPIPKEELLGFLLLARDRYSNILTPRKLERLDMLIQEQQGTRPGPKEIQKMIRAAKETQN